MNKQRIPGRRNPDGERKNRRLRINFRFTGNNGEEPAKRSRAMAVAQLAIIALFVIIELVQLFSHGWENTRGALLILWLVCGGFALRGFFRVFGESGNGAVQSPATQNEWDDAASGNERTGE